ncbi:MAG: thiolase family protein, partial [Deltaproteobacteria bacterium]|nr:thiolase family protein [Deltaproteobacteria bacterium]
ADIIVAGGMESLSIAPYLLPKGSTGFRLGDGQVVDSLIYDGLRDAFGGQHMGECGDACAEKYHLSREVQDAYAIESYRRAQHAIESGAFRDEIVAVSIPQKKGPALVVDTDEEPAKVKFDRVPTLSPVFSKNGTVTAANASSISDGAAAVVVMSEERAKALKLKPLATIVAQAEASHEPEWFTTAPVKAVQTVLKRAGLRADDIDLFEINEAFAVVTMVAIKELGLDPRKVNVNGGAVALGHPLGATGARLLTTLLYALQARGARRGLVSLCNGGGEATAMIVERS